MKVDSPMTTSTVKDEILTLIAQAQSAREMALRQENHSDFGYPYAAGYAAATLAQIQTLVSAL
jgi:hypothetical protein